MNSNVVIGIVIALLVIGGGFLLLNNNNADNNVDVPSGTTDNTSGSTGDNSGSSYQTPATVTTPEKPTVETGDNTFVSSTTAGVTGQVKPNGASTAYWFEYGQTQSLGSKTTTQNIGSGRSFIPTPGFLSGLRASTLYYYRLSAKNSQGTANGGIKSFQTNTEPAPVGSAPAVTTQNATSISKTDATLNGRVDPNGANTTYWFEYGKDINLGTITTFGAAGNGSSAQSVSTGASGLEAGTKYYFRINAQNQFGTRNGTILSFTTVGPANPAAPTVSTRSASNITKTSADLNGRVNPNGAETTYWFEYSEDSLLGTLIGTGTPVKTLGASNASVDVSANVTGLKTDTKYFFRLTARNSEGTVKGSIMSFRTDK